MRSIRSRAVVMIRSRDRIGWCGRATNALFRWWVVSLSSAAARSVTSPQQLRPGARPTPSTTVSGTGASANSSGGTRSGSRPNVLQIGPAPLPDPSGDLTEPGGRGGVGRVALQRHPGGQSLVGQDLRRLGVTVRAAQLGVGEDTARIVRRDRPVRAEREAGAGRAQVPGAPGPAGPLRTETVRPVVGLVGAGVQGAVGRLHARRHVLAGEPTDQVGGDRLDVLDPVRHPGRARPAGRRARRARSAPRRRRWRG